jgi:nucleotide-binding universal stress UspA family protein
MTRFNKILVATDFSATADAALDLAVELARAYGSTVHVAHVVDNLAVLVAPIPSPAVDFGQMQADMERGALAHLHEVIQRSCTGVDAPPVVLASHLTAFALVNYARDCGADLIVSGTHGRSGVSAVMMGSVAQKLVRSAPCPVLTVRGTVPTEPVVADEFQYVVHK